MSLDINNNSYLYKNAVQGKKDEGKNKSKNSDDQNKKDSSSEQEQKGDNLSDKSAEASSLELMGAQNALMIKKESIVHTKSNVPTSNYDAVKETTQPRQFDLNSDLSNLDDKALKEFEKLEKEKNKKSKASTEEKPVDNNQNNDKEDILSKAGNYENYGIIKNSDGTFSIKNNPFGKFTKTTIEDYINKYILPSSTETWVNGYSQIYTVNGKKLFLIKVTTKDGTKAFRGSISENGDKYTIFFGVGSDGRPDGNNIIKKIKVITSF